MNQEDRSRGRIERLVLCCAAVFAVMLFTGVAGVTVLVYDALTPLAGHMQFAR